MKRFPFSSRIAAAAMGIFLAAAVPETNLFTNDMGQAGLMTVYGAPKLEADPAKEASVYTTAGYVCRIDAPEVNIYKSANENVPVIWTAKRGETFQVLGRLAGGWALVDTDSGRGYLKTSEGAGNSDRKNRQKCGCKKSGSEVCPPVCGQPLRIRRQ